MSVAQEIKQQLRPGKLSINDRAEDAESGRTINMVNPATGDLLTTVPDGAACNVDRAVAAAQSGQNRIIDGARLQ
jgi:acyl-CoA reductase-like NAD-dependent aldehyde dehydrogenase